MRWRLRRLRRLHVDRAMPGTFVLGNQVQTRVAGCTPSPRPWSWLALAPSAICPGADVHQSLEEASAHLYAVERGIDPAEDTQEERLLLARWSRVRACWPASRAIWRAVCPLRSAHLTCYPRRRARPLTHLLRAGALVGAAHAYW